MLKNVFFCIFKNFRLCGTYHLIFQYTVHGHEYDPYDEYTVSVIARHNEYDTQDASNPDFIASHFTGTVTKHQREGSFVAPDACCGSVRHNSKVSLVNLSL